MRDVRGLAKREREFLRRRDVRAICAALERDDTCSALGITVRSSSPVLALCRKCVYAGHDPATPLEAYRGDTLALRVKSIGRAAALEVASHGAGFISAAKRRRGSLVSQIAEAAE